MKIEVLGGAREVGGSCIAVETDSCKIALDYGTKFDEEAPIFPKNFDAVIVSHARLDHSGGLLKLSKKNPVIVGSKITRDVTVQLLHDMVKIQNEKGYYDYDDEHATKKNWEMLVESRFHCPAWNDNWIAPERDTFPEQRFP